MKLGFALVAVTAVLAVPASASAPTVAGLQRQITAINMRLAAMQQQIVRDEDVTRCGDAIQADNLAGTWHTLVLLAQYNGFPAQPDYPRFDDGAACARVGVTRSR